MCAHVHIPYDCLLERNADIVWLSITLYKSIEFSRASIECVECIYGRAPQESNVAKQAMADFGR